MHNSKITVPPFPKNQIKHSQEPIYPYITKRTQKTKLPPLKKNPTRKIKNIAIIKLNLSMPIIILNDINQIVNFC